MHNYFFAGVCETHTLPYLWKHCSRTPLNIHKSTHSSTSNRMAPSHACLLLLSTVMLLLRPVTPQPSPGYYPSSRLRTLWFANRFAFQWGAQHHSLSQDQRSVSIWLDRTSGSGFKSIHPYRNGYFGASIKLQPGYTAGVNNAFYLSNNEAHPGFHDEVDIELLGTTPGQPYTLQTNVYVRGSGDGRIIGREKRFHLWFDPTAGFHHYAILWHPDQLVFFVDDIPIRVYPRKSAETFPMRPMWAYGSIWDASAWATENGRYKAEKLLPLCASLSLSCVKMSGSSSSSSSSRVSIPNNLRKTIQNLKEIAKNHSDDEIYAMLRECSMDPNETAQKLLLQDPFHEVKRKRDKKKENNREPADIRWRPASQGRVGQGGRGNYSSRTISHDAGGEKSIVKENGIHQATDKGITPSSSPPSQDTGSKPTIPTSSFVEGLSNGPVKFENHMPVQESTSKDSKVSSTISVKESLAAAITNRTGNLSRASGSEPYAPPSDHVLAPSVDAHIPGSVSAIKREVVSQRMAGETTTKVASRDVSVPDLSSSVAKGSELNHSHGYEKLQVKSQGFDGNQFSDPSQATNSLSRTSSAGSRPSSNYNNRSQQLNGAQKVGIVKEWKPKSTNVKPVPVSGKPDTTDVERASREAAVNLLPASSSMALNEPNSKLRNKLEELQFSDIKHVIIPNHLQVPESERTGLSFGSFDANFGLTTSFVNDTESEKGSAELSEPSHEIVETAEEHTSSCQIDSESAQEADIADHYQSPEKMPENHSSSSDHPQSPAVLTENLTSREPDIASIPTATEYDQSKEGTASVPDRSQYSITQTAPTYSNFGLVPPMLGNQFTTFEGAEPQARDANHIPSFLVQQPFDPATSYYPSMYRPTAADGDGRFSPLFAPAPKYSGNFSVLPAQSGQTPQESGNSVLTSTGPAPLGTSSVMQTSLAVSQTSVPVFRQPPGVHISHYPHNFLPYSQYLPFYIQSPSMHPFLGNATFPQQPPTGNIYPAPGAAGAAPMKYSLSQYKPTPNAGNPSHIGIPTGYGTYNPTAVTTGSSTGSEDLASSQYKENNNVYITGQQSEGSVWIPTPGRDIPGMQSFYNLPTQGQHMAFPGIYHHPTQTVAAGAVHPMLQQSQTMAGAVEMVGPPGVYQQPQRSQMNWVNHF